jgi:GTP-binding protein
MIEWLNDLNMPTLVVATKSDKLSANKLAKRLKINRQMASSAGVGGMVPFSAITKIGKREIWLAIRELIQM